MTDKSGSTEHTRGAIAGVSLPERICGMISKGNLLRLVVSLTAFASLASLGGGFFDGH